MTKGLAKIDGKAMNTQLIAKLIELVDVLAAEDHEHEPTDSENKHCTFQTPVCAVMQARALLAKIEGKDGAR